MLYSEYKVILWEALISRDLDGEISSCLQESGCTLPRPFSRRNVFCLPFQRKINFIGNQGLDF